ncbi:MAG: hypothetical protein Q9195_003760 [Heterodermia aff. obscurata]
MSSSTSSPLSRLWQRWKTLRLPWRKHQLAGTDLAGNKYWFFRPTLNARPRRIMENNPRIPYSDIKIPPQWHQWLRYTRPDPPSLPELQYDVQRLENLKVLARAADERWAARPSVLDKPRRGNQELAIGDGEMRGTVGQKGETGEGRGVDSVERQEAVESKQREGREKGKEDPWKIRQGKAGEDWKPEAWSPRRVGR